MTISEKAGMMMIDTLLAGCHRASENTPAANLINTQHMTRFIVRNKVDVVADTCQGHPSVQGWTVTAQEFVRFANDIQARGIRGMYGYMADPATEPRWYRVGEIFGEDSALTSNIIRKSSKAYRENA